MNNLLVRLLFQEVVVSLPYSHSTLCLNQNYNAKCKLIVHINFACEQFRLSPNCTLLFSFHTSGQHWSLPAPAAILGRFSYLLKENESIDFLQSWREDGDFDPLAACWRKDLCCI